MSMFFSPASKPTNEAERLRRLEAYRVLDTASEDAFDAIVAEAARICGTPIALVSLVDRHRQWFKAKVGLDAAETPRALAFCAHAIHSPDPFVVPDATKDERFAGNPLVRELPNVTFYAGVPLTTPDELRVGTLCVIDQVARDGLTTEQIAKLQELADRVVGLLEARRLADAAA